MGFLGESHIKPPVDISQGKQACQYSPQSNWKGRKKDKRAGERRRTDGEVYLQPERKHRVSWAGIAEKSQFCVILSILHWRWLLKRPRLSARKSVWGFLSRKEDKGQWKEAEVSCHISKLVGRPLKISCLQHERASLRRSLSLGWCWWPVCGSRRRGTMTNLPHRKAFTIFFDPFLLIQHQSGWRLEERGSPATPEMGCIFSFTTSAVSEQKERADHSITHSEGAFAWRRGKARFKWVFRLKF